jgi:hypothetical protein
MVRVVSRLFRRIVHALTALGAEAAWEPEVPGDQRWLDGFTTRALDDSELAGAAIDQAAAHTGEEYLPDHMLITDEELNELVSRSIDDGGAGEVRARRRC